jgi:hypothetical protein
MYEYIFMIEITTDIYRHGHNKIEITRHTHKMELH